MGEIRCTLSPKAERNKKHFKWSVEFIFLSHLPINKSCTIFSVNSGYTQLLLSAHSICQLARSGKEEIRACLRFGGPRIRKATLEMLPQL